MRTQKEKVAISCIVTRQNIHNLKSPDREIYGPLTYKLYIMQIKVCFQKDPVTCWPFLFSNKLDHKKLRELLIKKQSLCNKSVRRSFLVSNHLVLACTMSWLKALLCYH